MWHHGERDTCYLEEELKELAETQELDYEETSQKLKERYDGYHFTANLREYTIL